MRKTAAVPRSDARYDTLARLLLNVTGRHERVALQSWGDGAPAYVSYPELGSIAGEIARGLIALGIQAGDRIRSSVDAGRMDVRRLGALCAGAVVAPIYHTNSPGECATCSALGRPRRVLRERRAGSEDRAVRDRCPSSSTSFCSKSVAPDAITLAGLRRVGARSARRGRAAGPGGRSQRISRPLSTRRVRPGRRRGAC